MNMHNLNDPCVKVSIFLAGVSSICLWWGRNSSLDELPLFCFLWSYHNLVHVWFTDDKNWFWMNLFCKIDFYLKWPECKMIYVWIHLPKVNNKFHVNNKCTVKKTINFRVKIKFRLNDYKFYIQVKINYAGKINYQYLWSMEHANTTNNLKKSHNSV